MTSPPPNAGALVGQRLGKYDLVALLALGGTAEIYLARVGGEHGFEKYMVVKCLHDHLADDTEFVRMFLDEARLGAQLEHSNIVQTLELGQERGRYFLVMEFLAGMSVAMISRKAKTRVPGGLLPVPIALGLITQACAGLHYAHERRASDGTPLNVVHRDISPQNLVVTFEGMLKLVDFGIAKAEMRETSTKSGTIKGKFAYMSPEQCLAQRIDRRTDIFALGTVLHEMLTGRRLFKRESTYETYQAIVSGRVPAPSQINHELDPALDPVVMRALAYDREQRYPTAESFGEHILSVMHSRGKSIGTSDVATFMELFFGDDIEEHGQRMRELIEGRQKSVAEDTLWDTPDGASDAAGRMPDDFSDVDEELSISASAEEPAGEATRIELNPLERVQQVHAEVEREEEAARRSGRMRAQTVEANRPRTTAQVASVAPPPTVAGKALGQVPPVIQPRSRSVPPLTGGPRAQPRAATPVPVAPAPAGAPGAATAGKAQARTLFGAPAPTPVAETAARQQASALGVAHTAPIPSVDPAAAAASEKTIMPLGPSAPGGPPAPLLFGGPPPAAAFPGAPPAAAVPGAPPAAAFPGAPPPAAPAPGTLSPLAGGGQGGGPSDQRTMLAQPAPGMPGGPPMPPQMAQGYGAEPILAARDAFPPVSTPTAFKPRAELIAEGGAGIPSGDLAVLASERVKKDMPIWVLVAAFLACMAVGLGVTVLIGVLIR